MKHWPTLNVVLLGCLLYPVRTPAQEKRSISSPASTIEQATTQLDKIDQSLAEKIATVRKTVDAEVAAKRVSESIAQSLRWSLGSAQVARGTEFTTIMASSKLPVENKTLSDGFQMLEVEWSAAQAQRLALIKAGANDLRERMPKFVRETVKASEVNALLDTVERLLEFAQSRDNATLNVIYGSSLQSYPPFLQAFRQFLEVQSQTDPSVTAAALSQLRNTASSLRNAIIDVDIQKRLQQALQPYEKALDEAQQTLDQMLTQKKPAVETGPALARLEEAANRLQRVRESLPLRPSRDVAQLLGIYRSLTQTAEAMEKGDFAGAKNKLGGLRDTNLQPLGAPRIATFGALVGTWVKQIEEKLQQAKAAKHEEMRAKLAAVKQPVQLEALAADLAKSENEARGGEFPRGFAQQLGALAAVWNSGNSLLFMRQNLLLESADLRYATELRELRQRIERDVLARTLQVPEIIQPPWNELPLEVGFDKLCEQLAAKGEWRRLLRITEGRSAGTGNDGSIPRESDLAPALRSYLGAQNLELAEQWSEAIQSYKAVLRCTSAYSPIKEAAARIKELSKKYPDVISNNPAAPSKGLSQ